MLKEFIKKRWYFYLFGVIILVIIDLLQLFVPKVLSKAIDAVPTITSMNEVKVFVWSIIGLAFGMLAGRFWWRYFIMGTSRYFDYITKKYLFEKILNLDMHFFDKHRSGDIMAYFTNDVPMVERMLGMGVVQLTDALFMTFTTVFFMATSTNWKLTLTSLIPLPGIIVISLLFGRIIFKRSRRVQDVYSELSGYTEETMDGVRVIKSFSILPKMEELFEKRARENFNANIALIKIWGVMWPLIHFVGSLAYFVVLTVGGPMVINNTVTLGDFIAFNSYVGMLIWPLTAYGMVMNTIQQGRAAMQRIEEMFSVKPLVVEPEEPVPLDEIETIEVKNLTFSYPGTQREVLRNVDFEVKNGQFIGIVGTVGSGKSTLVKVISKLYPVESGKVFINGIDINQLHSRDIRRLISYVPQETFLFSDSVSQNVAFGMEKYDIEKVKEMAKLAAVDEDIERFPEKYETMVGQRGVMLSGGQKQRLTIARALMRNASVYIFDDCLSAVDPETEQEIIKTLREEMKGSTMIIITHRLKVLHNADVIYVLDQGRILEKGSHYELLENEGLYARMYRKQLVVENEVR
ncbi:MAG TPA: ABC transporter ATP-binding protein [Fervidobacterium sp.]|nr:ABC transporter ATP-binding protein [Fervidobacterium sp.]HOK87809.1 ABC transporter ATP-binding protein [Fervidobacterium sp.]HOM74025.1 ABC transporter ATP-binding protein [Fervidobacterium sp.]HPP17748.1 ABC transporter ATP-binding protein [Fervidobacterium sp.]HRD19496.1 ABC transporter ATP-binding protein [Fervidobacterium sp.]